MKYLAISVILFILYQNENFGIKANEQCSVDKASDCNANSDPDEVRNKYSKAYNEVLTNIHLAVANYKPCTNGSDETSCKCYTDVIEHDLKPFRENGITRDMLKNSEKYGTIYKILDHKLYRSVNCMFPARCDGIEHFLRQLLPDLPNLDLIINTRDYPQLSKAYNSKGVVFSFSKTQEHADIMYPAWSFWAGGPAIALFPTGLGRWDKLRENIIKVAKEIPWSEKKNIAFFRGSRTSDERDSLVLLSRRMPNFVDAKYTKNQAWKSAKDTLHEEASPEETFEIHCQYKYLFNFRGVAASFRYKHLFLCNSLVFHVGNEWHEFFYFALKPWVHYVPLKSYPTEKELEQILHFFRQHDDLAQEIAQRGFDFMRNHLKMSDVECYWRKLLFEYKKLLKFTVATNKNLIELKT